MGRAEDFAADYSYARQSASVNTHTKHRNDANDESNLITAKKQAINELNQPDDSPWQRAAISQTAPDLAILDVRMPDISGMELARHLREKTTVPFMFFSAYSNPEIAQQAAQHGAVGFLVKPVDAANLVPAIEAALARAAEIRTLRQTESELNAALAAGRDTSIALGVIMERYRLSREGAFEVLRNYSRTRRRKIHDVAVELLAAEETLNLLQSDSQN